MVLIYLIPSGIANNVSCNIPDAKKKDETAFLRPTYRNKGTVNAYDTPSTTPFSATYM